MHACMNEQRKKESQLFQETAVIEDLKSIVINYVMMILIVKCGYLGTWWMASPSWLARAWNALARKICKWRPWNRHSRPQQRRRGSRTARASRGWCRARWRTLWASAEWRRSLGAPKTPPTPPKDTTGSASSPYCCSSCIAPTLMKALPPCRMASTFPSWTLFSYGLIPFYVLVIILIRKKKKSRFF